MATGERADRLKTETITAMKEKDKQKLTVLRMLQAAVKQIEIDTREELDDAGVVKVLRSYDKKVKDAIAGAKDSGRDDLLAEYEAEHAIVADFLPSELPDAELDALVAEAVAECGAESMKDMGKVMKAAIPRVGGRADGGRISAAVKRLLNG